MVHAFSSGKPIVLVVISKGSLSKLIVARPISSIRFWDQDNDKNKSGQWQDPKLSVQLCRGKCARIELSLGDLRETLRLEAEKYEDVSQSEPLSYRLGYSIGRSIFGSNDAPKKPAPSNARYKAWYPKYIQSQNRGCCYYHGIQEFQKPLQKLPNRYAKNPLSLILRHLNTQPISSPPRALVSHKS